MMIQSRVVSSCMRLALCRSGSPNAGYGNRFRSVTGNGPSPRSSRTRDTAHVFFPSSSDLRTWFEKHHDTARELRVGFHKKDSGTPSITWPESAAEAPCFGWIDGIHRRIDEIPAPSGSPQRRPGSRWSG